MCSVATPLPAVVESFSEFCYSLYALHHEWMTPSESYILLHACIVGFPLTLSGWVDGCLAIRGYCAVVFSLISAIGTPGAHAAYSVEQAGTQTNILDEDISAWTKFPRFGPICLAAFLGILNPRNEIPGILVPRTKIPDGPKSLQEIPRQCSQEVWNSALLCLALLDYISLLMLDHPTYIFTVVEVKSNNLWIIYCLLL